MMTEINLLPWREARRERRQREFIMMLVGAAIIGIAIWWFWNQSVHQQIDNQRARNQFVQQHIDKLQSKIDEISDLKEKRSQLISHMKIIQSLQANRPTIVHLFDQLVRTLPDGVYFTKVQRKGKVFSISGVAENNNQISTLMRNLDASTWFESPSLKKVTAQDNGSNAFDLSVSQSSLDKKKDDKQGGGK